MFDVSTGFAIEQLVRPRHVRPCHRLRSGGERAAVLCTDHVGARTIGALAIHINWPFQLAIHTLGRLAAEGSTAIS